MYLKKRSLFFVVISAFLLLSLQCALFPDRGKRLTDKQKEEGLIELLNTRQEQIGGAVQSDDEIQKLKQQIGELEKQISDYKEEINTLKSEIDLKSEKISQLERSQITTIEKTPPPVRQETKQPAPPGSILSFEEEYNIALEAFRANQYQNALKRFTELLQKDRNNSLSDNCQYWIGECYFALKDYKQAIIAFEKVLFFPKSNKEADAQFKLGYTRYKMGEMNLSKEEFTQAEEEFNHAKDELNKLIEKYSLSSEEDKLSLVRRAKSLLEKIKIG